METEPRVKWKSDWLRFGMLPFKAYLIGVPIVLVLWQTQFREASPRGWDAMGEKQYVRVLEEIFATVQYGYLACVAGLVLALVIGCRIRDVSAVRAALIYGLAALFCLFWSYQFAHPSATR